MDSGCGFTNAYYTIHSKTTRWQRLTLPAAVCTMMALVAGGGRAAPPADTGTSNRFTRLIVPYRTKAVPPVNLKNSSRLDALMRAGSVYLSIHDAVALALENNLDIEMQRYGSQAAEANVLRAEAGGFAAPAPVDVTAGPASVTGGPAAPGLQSLLVTGSTETGTPIPNLDPVLAGSANWAHQTIPQSSSLLRAPPN